MRLRSVNKFVYLGLMLCLIALALFLFIASPSAIMAQEDAWLGSYWNNDSLAGPPVLVRWDPAIDFYWKGLSPDTSIPVDHFSARWTRTVNFNAGTYEFRATMDDGMRVWVDGKLIINDWNEGKERTDVAQVQLSNGPHELRVDYFELGGTAVAGFTWVLVSSDGSPQPPSGPPPGNQPPGNMPPSGGPGMPPPSGEVIYPVGEVKSPYLNMRQGAGTNYAVIAVLKQNTEVYIMARSSGSTWYLVKTQNGPTGWVRRYYIHTDFPYTSLPVAETYPMPTPQPPAQKPPDYPVGTVKAGFLNLRSGPGINYNAIAVVSNGSTVALLGRNASGTWLKVKVPTGSVGWVNAGYIATSTPIQTLPAG